MCSNLGLMGTQKNKKTEPKVLDVMVDKHVQAESHPNLDPH